MAGCHRLHEAFGLTGDIRRKADRLAAEGYLAFVPDLYSCGPRIRCVGRPPSWTALTVLDVPHDVKEYPGVGHSFLAEYNAGPMIGILRRVTGMHHDPEVAADAWRRIFAFFVKHLHNGSTK